jgi:hypothetical protein
MGIFGRWCNGRRLVKEGELLGMYEEGLVDCDRGSLRGVMGGGAYNFVKENRIEGESEYLYQGVDGKCGYSESEIIQGLKVTGFTLVDVESENALKAAIAKTTDDVSIDAK